MYSKAIANFVTFPPYGTWLHVDARYKDSYEITKEQLEYLAKCVELLRDQTQTSCEKKMETFI